MCDGGGTNATHLSGFDHAEHFDDTPFATLPHYFQEYDVTTFDLRGRCLGRLPCSLVVFQKHCRGRFGCVGQAFFLSLTLVASRGKLHKGKTTMEDQSERPSRDGIVAGAACHLQRVENLGQETTTTTTTTAPSSLCGRIERIVQGNLTTLHFWVLV